MTEFNVVSDYSLEGLVCTLPLNGSFIGEVPIQCLRPAQAKCGGKCATAGVPNPARSMIPQAGCSYKYAATRAMPKTRFLATNP